VPDKSPLGEGDSRQAVARFEDWADRHLESLYRLAYRLLGNGHDAEDVVQETFRSAWASRQFFDGRRSERAWLTTILRRRVADHYRKRSRGEAPLGEAVHAITAAPQADPFADELSTAVQQAVDRLPQELRETLLLVVVGELTHQEAADMLGVPLGTVLSRVSRGRSRLRQFLASSDAAGRNVDTPLPRGGR